MSKHRLFRFKKFSIDHSGSAMKVGTDGVLLGAWVNMNNASRILDIGTGSGVIALMMAQRSSTDALIDAVEIETAAAELARHNVENSPWPEKVKIHPTAVQQFTPGTQYDLIISNPPFFVNSYYPPDEKRGQARHSETLPYTDLIERAVQLLNEKGTFNVIFPPVEAQIFIEACIARGLSLTRKWLFRTRQEKPAERWLLEFSMASKPIEEGEILLYANAGEWSDAYKNLTGDFYLKA